MNETLTKAISLDSCLTSMDGIDYETEIKIHDAMERAILAKSLYNQPQVMEAIAMHFKVPNSEGKLNGKNKFTQSLLSDILLARITDETGMIMYSIDVTKEALTIVNELGIKSLFSDEMKNLTPQQVFEAIVSGNLKLTHQTELDS